MGKILTPGGNPVFDSNLDQDLDLTGFLLKNNYLGEFEEEFEKLVVRNNLEVPYISDVYTKTQSDLSATTIANLKVSDHLAVSDPHSILPKVDLKIANFVKKDGTTPFTAPQTGVDPVTDFHLTTKRFVAQLLQNHLSAVDPHHSLDLINSALTEYVKAAQVFTKTETYNRSQVDNLLKMYTKRDGTTSFTSPQKGIAPQSDYDLATKKYIDDLVYGYINESDLDNFKLFVNNALSAKAKSSEVYKKTETYSKVLLDLIISQLVTNAAQEAIEDHIDNTYHMTVGDLETYLSQYVKKTDLTTPDADYVTLTKLNELLISLSSAGDLGCNYIPHGPTLSPDVGFVNTGRDLPNPISYQDLFDIIFYDSKIDVSADPIYIEKGVNSTVCVKMSVFGITLVDTVKLFLNDVLYNEYDFEYDFVDGVLTVCGVPVNDDTLIKMVVHYKSGDTKEATCNVYAIAPIYIGLLPKWYNAANITYDFLLNLVGGKLIDATTYDLPIWGDSINNKKLILPVTPGELVMHYNFNYDGIARHLFIMYPKNPHPVVGTPAKLYEMDIPSQQFVADYITDIPIELPNGFSEIYEAFIYNPAVTSLNVDVTYKFKI